MNSLSYNSLHIEFKVLTKETLPHFQQVKRQLFDSGLGCLCQTSATLTGVNVGAIREFQPVNHQETSHPPPEPQLHNLLTNVFIKTN